jgi:hypothetical protein
MTKRTAPLARPKRRKAAAASPNLADARTPEAETEEEASARRGREAAAKAEIVPAPEPTAIAQVAAKVKGVRPGTKAADLLAFLIATPGDFDTVNEAAVRAGKFPSLSDARDWARYVLRQAGELVAEQTYRLPGRAEPITITKKSGGRKAAG